MIPQKNLTEIKRRVGRGTAAHASHSLHAARLLLKTARNQTTYKIKEPEKLISIAMKLKLNTSMGIENIAIFCSESY